MHATPARLNQIASELQSSFKVSARVIAADLSRAVAPAEIYRETERASVAIDYLVNNAGFGAGGAALGTLLGAIAGGGAGAAIGAAAGAAAGAGAQVLTQGKQINVPAESVLTFSWARICI